MTGAKARRRRRRMGCSRRTMLKVDSLERARPPEGTTGRRRGLDPLKCEDARIGSCQTIQLSDDPGRQG